MNLDAARTLTLESLGEIPVVPPEAADFYKQNCMVCFHSQGHRSGVGLKVVYKDSNETYQVYWSGEVTRELIRAYADLVQATEPAACAIALLLIQELTELTGVEQATRGTAVDYYLAPKNRDDDLIFNRAARLEASGILEEKGTNTVERRIKEKARRLNREDDLPTFIAIVEFKQPWAKVVEA